jgi:GT2 family glycosyltransferase
VSAPVTIAVVSWNTRDLLRRCLQSMRPEVDAGRAEVWVVDNGSADGSRELVAEQFGWASLLTPEENLGFGRAVNLVASETSGDWIVAANADVALEPGALKALIEAGEEDGRVGAVAPRLLLPDGSTQHSVHSFPRLGSLALFNSGLHRLARGRADELALPPYWDPERAREVDWAIGAFLLLRREAFDEAGGFDPGQWMYAEDLDLGWRLARAGWQTRYEPRARALHESAASTTQAFGDDPSGAWMDATYRWLLTRRGRGVAVGAALLYVLGALGRWALLAPASLVAPRRWGPARRRQARWLRVHLRGLRYVAVTKRAPLLSTP